MPEHDKYEPVTRQEQREYRLDKKKKRIPQHGKSIARVYKQAVEKRVEASMREEAKGTRPAEKRTH
jgi:hypothetical protein